MADTENREHPEHPDQSRVKTAREILEERLSKMKGDAPTTSQALKEAADHTPAGAAGAGPAPKAESVDERVKKAEKERDEFKNAALMAKADLDNYQKRIRREMDDLRTYASAGVLADVIAVLDNLDLSIAAAKAKPDLELFMQGVDMVRGQIEKLLADRGATQIPAVNVPFDPRKHEAVMIDERADVPDGTATQELRRGYQMKDRVLRAAGVKVSRGGPKAS